MSPNNDRHIRSLEDRTRTNCRQEICSLHPHGNTSSFGVGHSWPFSFGSGHYCPECFGAEMIEKLESFDATKFDWQGGGKYGAFRKLNPHNNQTLDDLGWEDPPVEDEPKE